MKKITKDTAQAVKEMVAAEPQAADPNPFAPTVNEVTTTVNEVIPDPAPDPSAAPEDMANVFGADHDHLSDAVINFQVKVQGEIRSYRGVIRRFAGAEIGPYRNPERVAAHIIAALRQPYQQVDLHELSRGG